MQLPRKMDRQIRRAAFLPKSRTLELFIISAQGLRNVKDSTGKITTFAVAYVDPKHKLRTRMDDEGGSNPSWNQRLSFSIDERAFEDATAQLTIQLYRSATWKEKLVGKDKLMGTARILIADAVKVDRSREKFAVTSILMFHESQPQGIFNVCVPPMGRFPDRFDFSLSSDQHG